MSFRRIVVVGTSGSGKTVLAGRIASALGLQHIEMDALFHGPGWVQREPLEFRQLLDDQLSRAPDGWVACGNYGGQLEYEHWRHADTIVWLDLPRWIVMSRVLRRTARRLLTQQALWNGNREHVSTLWSRDGIVRWAWSTHARRQRQYTAMSSAPEWEHLTWIRLRSPRQVAAWIDEIEARAPSGAADLGAV